MDKIISYEWELLPSGNYKRVPREVPIVIYQKSFVDDSDFMPNINGLSENLSGSSMTPLYDFNSKDDEFDNGASVAIRNPSLDVTEIDVIIKNQSAQVESQFNSAREAVNEEIEKIKTESESSSTPSTSVSSE